MACERQIIRIVGSAVLLRDDVLHMPPQLAVLQEPEILFDADKLLTKKDWIRAGELVFDQPIVIVPPTSRQHFLNHAREVPAPTTPDGMVPGWFYLVRQKGVVELGFGDCSECHTRAMPNGTFVKGAQGNFPLGRGFAWRAAHAGVRLILAALRSWPTASWLPGLPISKTGAK